MNNYRAWDYYTLKSKTKGDLRTKSYEGGNIIQFDSYIEAYTNMISMYDAENYNREDHGYWYIVRHSVVEYMENEEYHRNERVELCVA